MYKAGRVEQVDIWPTKGATAGVTTPQGRTGPMHAHCLASLSYEGVV